MNSLWIGHCTRDHTEIAGNEIADKLVKEAAEETEIMS